MDFLKYVKPTLADAIVKKMNGYTGSYCVDAEKSADKAYSLFESDIQEVLEDV